MLSLLDKFGITANLALGNNTVPQYYKLNNPWLVPSSLPPSSLTCTFSQPAGEGDQNIGQSSSCEAPKCFIVLGVHEKVLPLIEELFPWKSASTHSTEAA